MRLKTQDDDLFAVCEPILNYLQDAHGKVAEMVLTRCLYYARDRMMLAEMARRSGIELDGFRTSPDMEIYYDIRLGALELGFVTKGWMDPGFRIGNIIRLSGETLLRTADRTLQLLNECAATGVGVDGLGWRDEAYEVALERLIPYQEFTETAFRQALVLIDEYGNKLRGIA